MRKVYTELPYIQIPHARLFNNLVDSNRDAMCHLNRSGETPWFVKEHFQSLEPGDSELALRLWWRTDAVL